MGRELHSLGIVHYEGRMVLPALKMQEMTHSKIWCLTDWNSLRHLSIRLRNESENCRDAAGFESLGAALLTAWEVLELEPLQGPSKALGPPAQDAQTSPAPHSLGSGVWGFPKIRGTFLGVCIIRIIAFWGLYWGPLLLGNYHLGY